jgi:hypothetical protein
MGRQAGYVGGGIEAEIVGRDDDVVDVEQQPAAGPADELGEELGLLHGRARKADVSRQILDQDGAAEVILHLPDIVGDDTERLLVMGTGNRSLR